MVPDDQHSAEMFASLFDSNKAKHFLSTLATLQETLGILNDIEISHRLLDELDAGAQYKSTILIRGVIERAYQEQKVKLNGQWELFSKLKVFWPL